MFDIYPEINANMDIKSHQNMHQQNNRTL